MTRGVICHQKRRSLEILHRQNPRDGGKLNVAIDRATEWIRAGQGRCPQNSEKRRGKYRPEVNQPCRKARRIVRLQEEVLRADYGAVQVEKLSLGLRLIKESSRETIYFILIVMNLRSISHSPCSVSTIQDARRGKKEELASIWVSSTGVARSCPQS